MPGGQEDPREVFAALLSPSGAATVDEILGSIGDDPVALTHRYMVAADDLGWEAAERQAFERLFLPNHPARFIEASGLPASRARALLAGLLVLELAAPRAGQAVTGEPGAAPAARDSAKEDEERRQRRRKMLDKAFRTMGSVPPPRAPVQAPAPQPPKASAQAAPPPPAAPQAAPPADDARRLELKAVIERAASKDLFARMGLASREASPEQIRQAFLEHARKYHPDRIGAELEDLRLQLTEAFARLNEANDILSKPERRADWVRRNPVRDPTSGRKLKDAKLELRKGDSALERRDFSSARTCYEEALQSDPTPDAMAALAWILLFDPQHPDPEQAKDLLDAALTAPKCDRALYVSGVLLRVAGDEVRAKARFEQAIQLNPRNAEAQRELRILSRRQQKREGE
jgi:tetratricopeptide (TPR) repeat protein